MALPTENSCAVKFDHSRLEDNGTLANASNSMPKQAQNFNIILNPYENFEKISDPTLDYISQYLLEEDIDENISGHHEVAALRKMEKPFYEVLGEKYPPSPNNRLHVNQPKVDHRSISCLLENQGTEMITAQNSRVDENLLASEFQRGIEEGMKFLPTIHNLTVDLQVSRLSSDSEKKIDETTVELRPEEEDDFGFINRSKGKKNLSNADFYSFEGGNRKRPMIYYEEAIRSDMFDKVLLDHGESYEKEEVSGLREIMRHNANTYVISKENQDEHIDLNTLLIHCAEAVSINNHRVVEELLTEIRKKSSRTGSGTQRFASVLADGLEARLTGFGSELYRELVTKRTSTADILKAYHLFITAAPFYKISYCFANSNILNAIQNERKVHIVDLGISFGFQWPPLIQSLASRPGGAPKLRITGVDFPQRGFHPSKRVEEVGRRL